MMTGGNLNAYPWARLRPLPEAVVAWMTLRGLPGVESQLRIGWAPVGLMLATHITAERPGCELWMAQQDGAFAFTATGGTYLNRGNVPVGRPTSAWVNSIASRTCELCARPAKHRLSPSGARCDVCEFLSGSTRYAGDLPSEPRLPLTDDAREAELLLADETDLRVPAGWARPARDTIHKLGDASPSAANVMTDRGDHLALDFVEGDNEGFTFVAITLEEATQSLCKYCGRRASTEEPYGICDGCRAVRSREYELLRAGEDGTVGY